MHRVAVLFVLAFGNSLHAGMPSISFTDLGRFRLQSLSFFLVVLLVMSLVVWWLWNSLRKDFPRLPHLRFVGAVGLMTLWGLLVLVVLTMISGARELLSPKAWVKDGLTYRIADEVVDTTRGSESLEDLREALWRWSDSHEGVLPVHEFGSELPERRWRVPGTTAGRYHYRPVARGSRSLLAWEPQGLPVPRWVLRGDGTVEALDDNALNAALAMDVP